MKKSDTQELAERFVVDFLGRELDYRRDKKHLAHAKALLKPRDDLPAYTKDQVINCLQALTEGVFKDWDNKKPMTTMLVVMYGEPPFIERMKNIEKYIPPRPPYYNKEELKEWNKRYAWLLDK